MELQEELPCGTAVDQHEPRTLKEGLARATSRAACRTRPAWAVDSVVRAARTTESGAEQSSILRPPLA